MAAAAAARLSTLDFMLGARGEAQAERDRGSLTAAVPRSADSRYSFPPSLPKPPPPPLLLLQPRESGRVGSNEPWRLHTAVTRVAAVGLTQLAAGAAAVALLTATLVLAVAAG